MKKYLRNAAILAFGFGVAVSFSSCHRDNGSSEPAEVISTPTPTHTVSGVILDGNGNTLTGASVLAYRNGSASARKVTVTGNTFSVTGLNDGNWQFVVTKSGYKSAEETINLQIQSKQVEGKMVRTGMNVEQVFYLNINVESNAQSLGGSSSQSDEIVIETTKQDDGTGTEVNTTDGSGNAAGNVTVTGETPAITGDDYNDINQQIIDQTGGEQNITNYTVTLTNVTSLEDAKAVARANRIASSRVTRADTSLPGGNELLAGVGVNAGSVKVQFPAGITYDVTISVPDNATKNAIKLYRTITGDAWSELTTGNGIASIDMSKDKAIVIKLNILQTQSFAIGVQISETTSSETTYEPISAQVSYQTAPVAAIPYTVKGGVVLTNEVSGYLTDFLRKIVLRKYGTRAVREAQIINKTYEFTTPYKMHENGTLYLAGFQEVTVTRYSIVNASASFRATEYGEAFVYPYEVYPETEETHVGGSN